MPGDELGVFTNMDGRTSLVDSARDPECEEKAHLTSISGSRSPGRKSVVSGAADTLGVQCSPFSDLVFSPFSDLVLRRGEMRLLTWSTAAAFAFMLVCTSPVLAQQDLDAVTADPTHHWVEFENDQVRVVRYKVAPGDQTARHSHPALVNVFLTDVNAQNTTDDGKVANVKGKAGDAVWRGPLTHVSKNVGDKPFEGILIEPKNPHSARPAGSADETTFPGARAKVLFENEQVRVVRYRFNPGEKNEMHGHPDNVQVVLTDAKATVTTPDGKTIQSQGKAGQVNWRPATVHSVQNTGEKPFEGVLVEMKNAAKRASN
jgi:beta-alanine degradation protein BauB